MSFTMVFSKLYIFTELHANDLKLISIDWQMLDLSKDVYLWYGKFYIFVEIQPYSTSIENTLLIIRGESKQDVSY